MCRSNSSRVCVCPGPKVTASGPGIFKPSSQRKTLEKLHSQVEETTGCMRRASFTTSGGVTRH